MFCEVKYKQARPSHHKIDDTRLGTSQYLRSIFIVFKFFSPQMFSPRDEEEDDREKLLLTTLDTVMDSMRTRM